MNRHSLLESYEWIEFSGQHDSHVTYFFTRPEPVMRLRGSSDILYIGKTTQHMSHRYEQEVRTNNSAKNTQQTNIRHSYIYRILGIRNPHCYFTRSLDTQLDSPTAQAFLKKLMTWDKKSYLSITESHEGGPLAVSLEKYLLVQYADEHLEVPPLNNSM